MGEGIVAAGGTASSEEVLVFEVAGTRYAIPARSVQELVRAVAMVPLPKAPPMVEGVINVRGTLVPVLDLRARFGLPLRAVIPSDHLIIAWAGGRRVAVRCDRALDLHLLKAGEAQPIEALVLGTQYVTGVAKLPGGLVLLHDLAGFLSQAEAEALDRALGARPRGGQPT